MLGLAAGSAVDALDGRHVSVEAPVADLHALLDEDRVAALARGPEPLAAQAPERSGERGRGRAWGSRALEELVEEAMRGRVLELSGRFDTRSELELRLSGR